jgi:NDP-sugar pyrophosphorylase family protein
MSDITVKGLFSLERSIARELLENAVYPWDILSEISDFVIKKGMTLSSDEYDLVGENVWIAKDASVASSACISGPAIIDNDAEIRHCAYIRGSAIVGKGAVVGNSCELKNCILFDGVQVPHYNYVGDSVLGRRVHLGAGAICSNLKSDGKTVVVHGEEDHNTGLRKVGAFLGDGAEIGCGCILNPGTVIGKGTIVYPNNSLRGVFGEQMIVKKQTMIVKKR